MVKWIISSSVLIVVVIALRYALRFECGIVERVKMIAEKPRMAIYTLVSVLLIAAVAVGCTLTGAENNEKAPWNWAQEISAADITSASVWSMSGSMQLSKSELEELVTILNALTRDDFVLNVEFRGSTPEYGLRIECGDVAYNINESTSGEGALEMSYDGEQWWIANNELTSSVLSSIDECERKEIADDQAEADYRKIRFYMQDPEAAGLAFAREIYGTRLVNLPENNRFRVTDYEMLDYTLLSNSETKISGVFTFAVKPVVEVYYVGLYTRRGAGDYEDWLILTRSFTLELDDEGYWNCTELNDVDSSTN